MMARRPDCESDPVCGDGCGSLCLRRQGNSVRPNSQTAGSQNYDCSITDECRGLVDDCVHSSIEQYLCPLGR